MQGSQDSMFFQQTDLEELYQEVILEHSRRPLFKTNNKEGCRFCREGKNPVCGDEITLYCRVSSTDLTAPKIFLEFDGSGCSISQASASILCSSIQGLTVAEAFLKAKEAEQIYTGKARLNSADIEQDVEALQGVSRFPVRIKCAALPWKTLELLLSENFDTLGFPSDGCNTKTSCKRIEENKKNLKIVKNERKE